MTDIEMIASGLAQNPRFAAALAAGTPLDLLAAAMLVRAHAMGSDVAKMPLREIAPLLPKRSAWNSAKAEFPRPPYRVPA